jgi:hypothetical protein
MAHSGAGRVLAAKSEYPVQGFGHDARSVRGRKMRQKEEAEPRSAPPNTIVVEQWICFVLGFACVAFGAWGICLKPAHGALPEHIAWLGSLYAPALRLTAAACLGMGIVLIRRGWSQL